MTTDAIDQQFPISIRDLAHPISKGLKAVSRFCLYALVIFPPLAMGGAIGWSVPIIEWLALLAISCVFLRRIILGRKLWVSTPMDRPFIALAAVCALSTVFSINVRNSLSALGLLAAYIAVFYVAIDVVRTRDGLRKLCYVIVGLGVFVAVFGIFKYFGANPFTWWEYHDQLPGRRLGSTYYNSDHLAGLMEMTLCLGVGLLMAGLSRSKRIAIGLGCLFMATALVISLSRGGWAGALVGLGLIGVIFAERRYFRRGIIVALIGATFVVMLLVILMSSPTVERILTAEQGIDNASWSSRVTVWKATRDMIADHPVFGVGPGNFSLGFTQYQPEGLSVRFFHAHNDYLHIISEIGLLLIPVVLWMTIVLIRQARIKINPPSRLIRGTTIGALAGITAIIIHSIGDFNLHLPANALSFIILAAIFFSSHHDMRKKERGFDFV
ncbi:O-antigen ligase family protein [Desulfatibacillum aliphaticivorans]|uniref:O-antigen ligase family protein n=1 Tax=Desulfatibacillum aliphaticivorans TaxID=218208 RepID=UPI00143BAB9D|nr:O-antigen ligase family protein [Desulfatibacillum aliphaticivorans]